MGRTPPHTITGLYDPQNEHDACGVGMVAHIKGAKNHAIVTQALEILANGGEIDYEGATGVNLIGPGESAGSFREIEVQDGKNVTVKFR